MHSYAILAIDSPSPSPQTCQMTINPTGNVVHVTCMSHTLYMHT